MRPKLTVVILSFSLLFLGLSAVPGDAQDFDKVDFLEKVRERYAGTTGLTADYQRTTTSPSMEGVFKSSSQNVASGVLLYKKPDKLSLDQKEPRPEKLVTDGRTVWWYIPEEKMVHRYSDVDVYGELKPILDFLGGLAGLEEQFLVRVIPAGTKNDKNHRLDLARLTEGPGPQDITVWLAPDTLTVVGFKITSLTGESTVFNLTHVDTQPKLKDDQFIFTPPPDAEVVDEAGVK
ncbi:MAG: outer membrane lipoprotein carrier protein LolA [Thermodesulfobacteriota bacterium]